MRDPQLMLEVAELLFREAELLDDGSFHEWLEGVADDIRYVMPATEVLPPSKEPQVLKRREQQRWGEIDVQEERLRFWLYDEDHNSLTMRIRRLDTGMAYAELPESITSRMVTNVRAWEEPEEGLIRVTSKILVHQVRHEDHEDFFVGRRWDKYRRVDGQLRLLWRYVELGHPVLPRTISILF
ncbi:MAG: aromatic-ring-hydroxylating dioxygenase subunit beta [Actinobacteria bacterium]|nr:aromatic-ring-hydroxylating dioxygenase subunit beta [Actinomycetota bacterium]